MAAGAKLPPLADEMKPPQDPVAQQRGVVGKAKQLLGDGAAIVASGVTILFSGFTPRKGLHTTSPSQRAAGQDPAASATSGKAVAAAEEPIFLPPNEKALQPEPTK